MELVIDIPKSLYANLQKIQNGSIAAKRILECVRNGKSVMYYPQVEGITPTVVDPNTDCISRQAAIDVIERWLKCSDYNEAERHIMRAMQSVLYDLPPVTPAENVGHWELVQYDGNPNIGNWHCSECRTIIPHMPEETDKTPIYKWCPMCGAKMQKCREEMKNKGK